jgi:RNA polymerase sigma-70 factor (ECF subfamily)
VNLKRAERKTTSALPEDPPGRDIHGPDETAAEREAIQVVRKAMDSLAPEFREAILLRIDEELSFRDIAEIMSITEETARWRVFKARRLLMKAIGSEIWSLNPEANSTDPS